MITQERLKELLNYNPDTGDFTIKTSRVCRGIKDSVAGWLESTGYIRICLDYKKHSAHRLAFLFIEGRFPNRIDHINHIRNDNRWVNLREVTHQENSKNQSINSKNTSGVMGVCWFKARNKWHSQIKISQKNIHLGYYLDKFDAICARKSAENKHNFHPNHGK